MKGRFYFLLKRRSESLVWSSNFKMINKIGILLVLLTLTPLYLCLRNDSILLEVLPKFIEQQKVNSVPRLDLDEDVYQAVERLVRGESNKTSTPSSGSRSVFFSCGNGSGNGNGDETVDLRTPLFISIVLNLMFLVFASCQLGRECEGKESIQKQSDVTNNIDRRGYERREEIDTQQMTFDSFQSDY